MRRCDAIIRAGLLFALLGATAGVVLSHGAGQMVVYAAVGVWGGAICGALLGAIGCMMFHQRREPPQKLRAV